ncbi:MAG: formate dehydrogenase accessory sulfurtransferase FdhD [Anaerolineae bacterium]|jgi:FdhD protein|nr:formate dehydrogenase accessory sulfurtransferase FdhD [Anaerolineae bacterium]MDH7473206.1 formate dehydrogenase accessory sulfurtransferase FdhD [Anaerolineae bacterium]
MGEGFEAEIKYASDSASLIWPIQRIRENDQEQVDDRVVIEEPLEIVINGQRVAVLMRMPGQEKELAAGFCVTEGYVRRADDILLIHHCGSGYPASGDEGAGDGMGSRNRVELRVIPAGFRPSAGSDAVRLIRSGCGAAEVLIISETLPPVVSDLRAAPAMLLGLGRAMRDLQSIHPQVGGTHSAALFLATGEAVILAEDIGRHNAVDKALGYCLLQGTRLDDKILVTSGRASYEMVMKAVRVNLPMLVTLSAPTSLAVQLAGDKGLTLIGYLRGGRMNVYTHPWRVES